MAKSVNGMLGYQTKVSIDDDTDPTPVPQELVDVTEIVPPNAQGDDVEVTHYQSLNRTREYIPGFIEPGEATITMNRRPNSATEIMLLELKDSGDVRKVTVEWPNGVKWEFDGYVKGYETASPIDDRMTATATLKVAGATTVVAGP